MARDNKKSVLDALGSPVLASFPDELRLTKRNLLFVSAVVIFIKMSGMKIGEESVSLLGLSFSNPGQLWLDLMLLGTILYLSVQFAWQTIDYATQTRLRITGTKLSWVTGAKYGGDGADYPDDPAQSSLYYWWSSEALKIGNLRTTTDAIYDATKATMNAAKDFNVQSSGHLTHIMGSADRLHDVSTRLLEQLNVTEKALSSERIPISLERFDRWFWNFERSQVWRAILLDIVLPALMAAGALSAIGIPHVQERWPF